MKRFFFLFVWVSILISLGGSTVVDAGDFVSLIDGYRSMNLPVVKLPWLSKEAYLESALPKSNRIFSYKKDFRIEELNVYQRDKPEVELYFYKNQLCEVAYFFRRPASICLENYSECDDFGKRLHLIIKKYGPGKTGNERLVIWPAGYEVERRRSWSVGNIKIGLYEMTGSATSILLAKHIHLNKAIFAAQQKYREKKVK
jgi:hypothetical protein